MSLLSIVRWVHIISGVAWLGEVVTVNFVLLPALFSLERGARGAFIRQVFPRIFRLASVLSLTAILSGAAMNYLMTGWKNLGALLGTRWGIAILIGGSLGLLLTLFHFFAEERLEPVAVSALENPEIETDKFLSALKIIPRAGVLVILTVVLLMMYAARGV
ncbi:MAG: hypothetical protein IT314_01895 [Anaerolineales bacterium]|nr:hypothetical protein [Anaerolineales bacterium]